MSDSEGGGPALKWVILVPVIATLVVGWLIFYKATPAVVTPSMVGTSTNEVSEVVEDEEEENSDAKTTADTTMLSYALIALEDNGKQGRKIGCNDSVVMVDEEVPKTTSVLRESLSILLSLEEENEDGLYNAFASSDLTLKGVTIKDGLATINLEGQLSLGGVCDAPRVQAQLEETALQFSTVNSVEIFLNGELLDDVLSQR